MNGVNETQETWQAIGTKVKEGNINILMWDREENLENVPQPIPFTIKFADEVRVAKPTKSLGWTNKRSHKKCGYPSTHPATTDITWSFYLSRRKRTKNVDTPKWWNFLTNGKLIQNNDITKRSTIGEIRNTTASQGDHLTQNWLLFLKSMLKKKHQKVCIFWKFYAHLSI